MPSVSSAPSSTSRNRLKANLQGSSVASLLNPSSSSSSNRRAGPSINYAALNRRHIRDTEERRRREKVEAEERSRQEPFKMLRFQNAQPKALNLVEQKKERAGPPKDYLKKHTREEKDKEKVVNTIQQYNHNLANLLQQHHQYSSAASVAAPAAKYGKVSNHQQSASAPYVRQQGDESIFHLASKDANKALPATKLQSRAASGNDEDERVKYEQYPDEVNEHFIEQEEYKDDDSKYAAEPAVDVSTNNSAVNYGEQDDEVENAYDHGDYGSDSRESYLRLKAISKPPVPSVHAMMRQERERQRDKEIKKERDYVKGNAREVILQSKIHANDKAAAAAAQYESPTSQNARAHVDHGRVPEYLLQRKAEMAAEAEAKLKAEEAAKNRLPNGLVKMDEEERKKTLEILQENYKKIQGELTAFPLRVETLSRKKRKSELESKLQEIEDAIKLFSRKVVYIKQDA